jgi:hypothetical protein
MKTMTSLKNLILASSLTCTALAPQLVLACASTPEGITDVLPSNRELPANGILRMLSYSNVDIDDIAQILVDGEDAAFEQIDLGESKSLVVKLTEAPAVGAEVEVLTPLPHSDEQNSYIFTVTEALDDVEVQPVTQGVRFITDQNQEPQSPGNCGGLVEDIQRQRQHRLYALIPQADFIEGSYVLVNNAFKEAEVSELDIDGETFVQLDTFVGYEQFPDLGPVDYEAPRCEEISILSPTGSLSDSFSVCDPCLFKTLGVDGELLSIREDTMACDYPLVSELDEHIGSGDVLNNEPNVAIEEEGGCDQSGQQSSLWLLLGLALFSMTRRFRDSSSNLLRN